jgi:hypothetical protein
MRGGRSIWMSGGEPVNEWAEQRNEWRSVWEIGKRRSREGAKR